ncbi:lipoate--protein ligase family protein [Rothia sp. ZJ1223]|uniref:lipoate--protein ligase family protein n=1 Tax=Rothia sp. ZJ1223 TaxID=2811098 RepID=UPI00195C9523|nr:lipoate--protein ligase family protein [Rothia sp. ZJ1223]MBM7050454.1 lipoate--protein ligase family protein [Rothia sp. ZJ1223]
MSLGVLRDFIAPGEQVDAYARSFQLLREVGAGERGATVRLYQPQPVVAFGRRDELNPNFSQAADACRDHGFEPIVRKVGGHAAAYHQGCLVIDHFHPTRDAITGNNERFSIFGQMYADALASVDVPAAVGEIPGEYCPGEYSVYGIHSDGRKTKLVGTAQRVVAGAWWFSAGIVVEGAAQLRAVTTDVYSALGLELNPATVGAVTDINPLVAIEDIEDAVLEAFACEGF